MAKTKQYIGLILEDDFLKVAVLGIENKKLSLQKIDKYSHVKTLEKNASKNLQEDL